MQDSPVDIIEIGIPFSDPLADGPILQEASEIALKNGATINNFFALMRKLNNKINTPITVMTYYNPVYHFGLRRFLRQVKECGLSGVMIVDLPIEEASQFIALARPLELDTIFFITSQTRSVRAKKIIQSSRGFIYYVSVAGITGPKALPFSSISRDVRRIKSMTGLAVCVGFGVHKKSQVKALSRISDGFIVGSALAKFIKGHYKEKIFLNEVNKFLKGLYV